MKHDPLNHKLIDEFPYLKENYKSMKDGVFDLDTPSTFFYKEIFIPYLLYIHESGNDREVLHCCQFIESMMTDEDEECNNLAMLGILCPLYESLGEKMKDLPLGENSEKYYRFWLMEKDNRNG